jgi:lipopolysaccharide transport system ATP-binding protein
VGTGFHYELTGRDNIYLSGAILGMRRAEIARKFDEIVDFSEVEKFIDTPVKHYSSGMRVRLAFAVAAHLEPEVLLVDEVLAVGDVAFQRKCLGKMGDVVGEGRTVLFVSHNMGAVKSLCQRGILLVDGRLEYCGPLDVCIRKYLKASDNGNLPVTQLPRDERLAIQVASLSVLDESGQAARQLPHDRPFQVQLQVLVRSRVSGVHAAFEIHDHDLSTLMLSRDFETDTSRLGPREPGLYSYRLSVPGSLLVPGEYSISAHIGKSIQSTPGRLVDLSHPGRVLHKADHACSFELVDNGSVQARMGFGWGGKLAVPLEWEEVDYVSKEISDG